MPLLQRMAGRTRFCAASIALLFFFTGPPTLRAQDILFIGNSFTYTWDIPGTVEKIATAKGKAVLIKAVTAGGKGWDYHLAQPETDVALKSQPWNWIVLQDYSLNATHVNKQEAFTKYGKQFEDRIAQESPRAAIVLYETWAYSPRHPYFQATATAPAPFANPDVMYAEIHKNYAALQALLQARDPKRQVLIAPVGTAFGACARAHPEINLYAPDFKHPSPAGSYLSALVLYATLCQDSSVGAVNGEMTDPQTCSELQQIAASVTQKKLAVLKPSEPAAVAQ